MTEGTRCRIYLQPPYVPGFEQPVTIHVDTGGVPIGAGPVDPLLHVLDAENKPGYRAEAPHQVQRFRGRPWRGSVNPHVAQPTPDGHFDHLEPHDPAFPAASVYATARHVHNFWNRVFADAGVEKITAWHHDPEALRDEGEKQFPDRLQLIPRSASAGARAGYGYVELGRDNPGHEYRGGTDGAPRRTYQRGAMWQNFDVIAHEVGHAILFRKIGFPDAARGKREWFDFPDAEFLAFHESMADLMAILALLDFKEAREYILMRRGGADVIAGVGELQRVSHTGFLPIRSALNKAMFPKAGTRLENKKAHENSKPLTAAVFAALGEVYRAYADSLAKSSQAPDLDQALNDAHHVVARALARLWSTPEFLWDDPKSRGQLRFVRVAEHLPKLVVNEAAAGSAYQAQNKPLIAETGIAKHFEERTLRA
jgi:hypothetical protein